MHKMCAAALEGNREEATRLNDQLVPLHRALFLDPNPTPAKWALHKMGYGSEGIRLPMLPLSDEFRPEVLEAMKIAGVM